MCRNNYSKLCLQMLLEIKVPSFSHFILRLWTVNIPILLRRNRFKIAIIICSRLKNYWSSSYKLINPGSRRLTLQAQVWPSIGVG